MQHLLQEMPLPNLVSTLRERAVQQDKNWFAYKTSEEAPQAFVAQRLAGKLGADRDVFVIRSAQLGPHRTTDGDGSSGS